MIGIEVKMNGQKSIIAVAEDWVFANLKHGYSFDRIIVKGIGVLHHLTWLDEEPGVGDKVLIRIVDTEKVSPVLTMMDCDRDEIKKRYEQLKIELQKKGLI